jgi:hypothetical protein
LQISGLQVKNEKKRHLFMVFSNGKLIVGRAHPIAVQVTNTMTKFELEKVNENVNENV